MSFVGIQSQIWRNNNWSIFLLVSFPILILVLSWLFFYFWTKYFEENATIDVINSYFLQYFPWIITWVALWFVIAYLFHTSLVKIATWARSITRKQNPRIYNLLENICISQWMRMPKLQVIEDSSLNAFASWIDNSSYCITLSRWIIEKLDDNELEAVIAHELTHIKNRDTRLLIISVIFVWIFSFLSEMFFRWMLNSSWSKKKWIKQLIILGFVLSAIWYIFSILIRYSLSRKREYLADAWAAEITRKPRALASALKKISWDPLIEALKRKDLASAFIENPVPVSNLLNPNWMFSTHPPIKDRIEVLEKF